MRGTTVYILGILIIASTGCQGATKAQQSFDVGMQTQMDVRSAFFVKAWTLNRALITEARQKWIGQAASTILENSVDGKVDSSKAIEVIAILNDDIGKDEAVISETFAYLAFLLVAGERADQYLGQVDIFLESKRPIWKHLSHDARRTTSDVLDEVTRWKPLVRDIENLLPKGLEN